MTFNPLVLLATIVGGLIVAAILGWIRKPRLITLVPRTFLYSQITDRGQLVEVTVFNRSFKTEEAIDVTLNPSLRYEILGSNSQDASVSKNRLHITRIGSSDEVTVLLIVEDGVFKADDIVQTLSKETKGKTISKLEEVPPTGPQRIALVAWLIVLPAFLYASTLGIDFIVKKMKGADPFETQEQKNSELQGWKISNIYARASNSLYRDLESNKMAISISPSSRRGDMVSVPLKVINSTQRVVKFSISMTSGQSGKRIPSYEQRVGEVLVLPGKSEERSIKVVIPEKSNEPAEKLIFMEIFLETMEGETLKATRVYPLSN